MDTLSAFARGQASRQRELMVFDWDEAARRIREAKPSTAAAGLSGDWEWTGGTIYSSGAPDEDSYTYLASTWATPELEMDGELSPCFRMQSDVPGWGADTKWPESAKAILAPSK